MRLFRPYHKSRDKPYPEQSDRTSIEIINRATGIKAAPMLRRLRHWAALIGQRLFRTKKTDITDAEINPTLCTMQRNQTPFSKQVAHNVVNYAKHIAYPLNDVLQCPDCHFLPTLPVTGYCGHTRCTKCVEKNGSCYCGCLPPRFMNVNILVRRLVDKMLPPELKQPTESEQSSKPSTSSGRVSKTRLASAGPRKHLVHYRKCRALFKNQPQRRNYTAAEAQYEYACELFLEGNYNEAAPHFAHAAASNRPVARSALYSLIETIEELVMSSEARCMSITQDLYRDVRATNAAAWIEPADLECVICIDMLNQPVTTPCGHTFCRKCIFRTVLLNGCCAICRHPIDELTIAQITDTAFVNAALVAVSPGPTAPTQRKKLLTIFNCTIAFPTVPCPILIVGLHHRVMISRILAMGNRRIGMVASDENGRPAQCGTIIEIRDCVETPEGNTVLSTVGVGRFWTMERCYETNCLTTWVIDVNDVTPTGQFVPRSMEQMADEITHLTMLWLSSLAEPVVSEIDQAFGPMPLYYYEQRWWADPQCPKWLWWIIAILPLKPTVQILMLSTNCLRKRMNAVYRTLDLLVERSDNLYFP